MLCFEPLAIFKNIRGRTFLPPLMRKLPLPQIAFRVPRISNFPGKPPTSINEARVLFGARVGLRAFVGERKIRLRHMRATPIVFFFEGSRPASGNSSRLDHRQQTRGSPAHRISRSTRIRSRRAALPRYDGL